MIINELTKTDLELDAIAETYYDEFINKIQYNEKIVSCADEHYVLLALAKIFIEKTLNNF